MATQEPMGTTRTTEEQRREEQRRAEEQRRTTAENQSSAQRRQARVRRSDGDNEPRKAGGTPGDENGEQVWPYTQARTAEEQDAMVTSEGKNAVGDNSPDTASSRANRRANTGDEADAAKQPRRTGEDDDAAKQARRTPTGGSSTSGGSSGSTTAAGSGSGGSR